MMKRCKSAESKAKREKKERESGFLKCAREDSAGPRRKVGSVGRGRNEKRRVGGHAEQWANHHQPRAPPSSPAVIEIHELSDQDVSNSNIALPA
jgi:hypothetical protein